MTQAAAEIWSNAVLAAELAAIDPAGCGGICLRAGSGPVRDRFLALLRGLFAGSGPIVKMPPGTTDDRLIGGLDITRTLSIGRPVLEPGLLARANGGLLLISGAERLSNGQAARIATALDRRSVSIERDGIARKMTADFSLALLDESVEDDEGAPQALLDRTAFWIGLDSVPQGLAILPDLDIERSRNAARRFAQTVTDDRAILALCETAAALGIASLRAPYLAARAARASAALSGRKAIAEQDLVNAVRLVLAPRALLLPVSENNSAPEQPTEMEDDEQSTRLNESEVPLEVFLKAAAAVLPPGLIETAESRGRPTFSHPGKSGRAVKAASRGRRIGSRPGTLGGTTRLDLVATLRAAAPFQSLRCRERAGRAQGTDRPILLERQDIRTVRYEQRSETLTVFVVDASGSSALNRLAEAKGAVELLLAECYARRDCVALIAFRAASATLLLPPTRSLTRAKRCLEALPGGGGTPLASGLSTALSIASGATRQGRTAITVLLTDGRANIALDGKPGRVAAEADAMAVAKAFASTAERTLLIDTAPRPQAFTQRLASAMNGRYVPLPYADAAQMSRTVFSAMADAS